MTVASAMTSFLHNLTYTTLSMLAMAGLAGTAAAQSGSRALPSPGAEDQPSLTADVYELQVYAPGADPASAYPFSTIVIPASAIQCAQSRGVAPAISINPVSVRWSDPNDSTRDCVADASAFLRTLPAHALPYVATVTVADGNGISGRSAASNVFFRVAAFGEP
jgi:hypothetical protein